MLNIFDFTRLYRRTIRAQGNTGSLVKIALKPVLPKILRVLTHVTVENEQNAYTKVRIGIQSIGVIHYLDELITIKAAELVVSRSDILLGEADIFFTELTGTTTDDVLIFTCIGWEKEI